MKIPPKSTHGNSQQVADSLDQLKPIFSIDAGSINALIASVKKLEFTNIKTLKSAKAGIFLVKSSAKQLLDSSTLTSRQKAEIQLISQLEAFHIVKALVDDLSE